MPPSPSPAFSAPSVDAEEIRRFSALAETWWAPDGPMKPLHRLNPVRLAFLRDRAMEHFQMKNEGVAPLSGLSVLDIGCGGGLVAEPLARLGAAVTGIDASEKNIAVATLHAEKSGTNVTYRHASAEQLVAEGKRFDLVLALEVVEHVADVEGFLAAACSLVRPGGALAASTLNRTALSYALAIVGAEYIMRWLPKGTHQWSKFLRPSELTNALCRQGMEIAGMKGLFYNPLSGDWMLTERLDVNYLLFATKPN
ncbi:MAG: bifunctional 2-polyprenyl-6-hydroxyphenol methylase/3-demethylubiquinol 3-O-methyltransferase UbiG [Alphaproteobacteria bacterium]|nr:bifunctional 2-polyprenyl-6-hydroxyphenol methylase/3-demethylubiquinol 3-O-methyltransferase UbiG [Alphaproteobacteria bacterium]